MVYIVFYIRFIPLSLYPLYISLSAFEIFYKSPLWKLENFTENKDEAKGKVIVWVFIF